MASLAIAGPHAPMTTFALVHNPRRRIADDLTRNFLRTVTVRSVLDHTGPRAELILVLVVPCNIDNPHPVYTIIY